MARRGTIIVLALVLLAGVVRVLVEGHDASVAGEGALAVQKHCTPPGASCRRTGPAPTSNAVLNQYLETVPSAGGGTPSTGLLKALRQSGGVLGGSQAPASGASSPNAEISRATLIALRSLGRNGSAAAALALAGGSGSPVPADATSRGKDAVARGSDAIGTFADVLLGSGSGGIGFLLPFALVAVILTATGGAVLSRRSRSG